VTIVDTGPQRERYARTGRFQFSLATALIVVTGVCVALSLVLWHWTFGLMAAILLVGSGWSAAARRAGYRKLAYCLAASALGVIAHLVLAGLFFAVSDPLSLLVGESTFLGTVWLRPLPILWMSMSTAVAAMLIRRLRIVPAWAGLVGVYLTAMIFPVFWGAFTLFSAAIPSAGPQTFAPEDGFGIALLGLVFGAFVATFTLPVTWPTGILFCVILRRIDPLPEVWVGAGREGWIVVRRDAEPSDGEWSGPLP
jgi:hypothetical protein